MYCDGLGRLYLYLYLYLFFIYVLCYCAATDFSVNKDLYYRVGLWCREYQACVDISNFIPYVAAVMLPFAVSTATTCYHNVPR